MRHHSEKHRGNVHQRTVSAGSILAAAIVMIVAAGLIYVLPRLSSGNISLSVLLHENELIGPYETTITEHPANQKQSAVTPETDAPAVIPAINPTPLPGSGGKTEEITLCFGGTVAIEEKVRKSAYFNDTKVYDFSQNLALLSRRVDADLNIVFFENLLSDTMKVSKTVVPSTASEMLETAGFDVALCGFANCYDKGRNGIMETITALTDAGLGVRGIYLSDPEPKDVILTYGDIRIALMQYTDSLEKNSVKQLKKDAYTDSVPAADAEVIRRQIDEARSAGAQVVVVCVNWGKTGDSTPSKVQQKLAKQIADAGADIIIGAGSRVPQKAEYLLSNLSDGTERKTFCAYSLGTLLSDSRDRINRMSGMLLKLTVSVSEDSDVTVCNAVCVPTYVWNYKQDGQNYYRTVTADGEAPDGMDQDQTKNRGKAYELIRDIFADGTAVIE